MHVPGNNAHDDHADHAFISVEESHGPMVYSNCSETASCSCDDCLESTAKRVYDADSIDFDYTDQMLCRSKRPRFAVTHEQHARKSVHFGADKIENVECVLNMQDVPKENLWVQSSEILNTINEIRATASEVQTRNSRFYSTNMIDLYVEALAKTYVVCCGLNDGSNQENPSLSTAHLAILGSGLARGMEAYAVPELAVERNRRKKENTKTTVQVDRMLRANNNVEHRDFVLASVMEQWSQGSARFARTVAAADATAAFCVHRQQQRQQNQRLVNIKKNIRQEKPPTCVETSLPPRKRVSAAAGVA